MGKVPLLDLGNVIIRVDWSPFISWVAAHSETKDNERIHGFLQSSLFYDYEFGNIEREEFRERMEKMFSGKFPEQEFEEKFCAIFPAYLDGMEESIERLLSKGPVYCLSNTNEMHISHARKQFPVLDKLTKLFLSNEMHKRKPYPGIYREVARMLNLQPEDLVFFDDIAANVQGAERAGLKAYIFEGAAHLEKIMGEFNHA